MLNGAEVVRLSFPMTRDQEILDKAWGENARRILAFIQQGKDVAFITIGDPLTYSTFGYVMETIQEMAPEVVVRVIPGVTSYQAATAAAHEIMAAQEQTFCVISGSKGDKKQKQHIKQYLLYYKTAISKASN